MRISTVIAIASFGFNKSVTIKFFMVISYDSQLERRTLRSPMSEEKKKNVTKRHGWRPPISIAR